MSRESTAARVALPPALAAAGVLLVPGTALADNCSSLGDCWSTAGGVASAAAGAAFGAIGGLFWDGGGSSAGGGAGSDWQPETPYGPPAPSNPDRGFRYTGPDGTVRDSPSHDGTVVADAPHGGRLMYDGVVRDANGVVTHYHVNVPGGPSGYIPAENTSDTRPTVPPPIRPLLDLDDSDVGLAETSSAQGGARG